MTTDQATPQIEAEATPTAETTTPEVEIDDSPLISPETAEAETSTEEQGQDSPKEGAAEAETDGAAESEEEQPPSPTLTREEHEAAIEEAESRVRSGLDKRISDVEKSNAETLAAAEQRAQAAEQQLQASQLDIDAARWQRQRVSELVAQGHTDDTAQLLAAQQADTAKMLYQMRQRLDTAEQRADQSQTNEQRLANRQSALELASQHGVHDDDMPLLVDVSGNDDADRLQKMTSLAKRLGSLNKQSQEVSEAKLAAVPAGGEANKVDSGGGAAGGLTDDQKMDDPNTPLAEIEEILKKRGEHPFL